MLAIVADVGKASIEKLLAVRAPITVAIEPYTPFAFRTARIAASEWHEVLAHVPKNMTSEAQRAVPLATGIWFDGTPAAPLGTHDVVVVPLMRSPVRAHPMQLCPGGTAERQDAMATLTRARHIAVEWVVPQWSLPRAIRSSMKSAWSEQAHTQLPRGHGERGCLIRGTAAPSSVLLARGRPRGERSLCL